MLLKIGALKNFENLSGKKPVLEALSKKVAGFLGTFFKKETPTQAFSCKTCKIFKSIFFYRTPLVAQQPPYAQQIPDHLQLT